MLPVDFVLVLAAAPEVALLSSQADVGELRFQPLGASKLADPVARFSHAEGSPVLGSLLPRSKVVVATAAMSARGDLSFASSLLRLEAGKPVRVLADQVPYGARPLVTGEGRLFIARGVAGRDLGDVMRVDALTVEELDPTTARSRLVYSVSGFVTFLAGALGRELVIYEVTPGRARLLAVHVDTLAVRVVVPSMEGLAHDFVVDAPRRRVLFTQGTVGGDRWFVEEVDLLTGASRRIAEDAEVTLLPTVLPEGRVLISRGAGDGLRSLEGERVIPAHGTGFERLVVQRKNLSVGLHERPSDFPSVFARQDGAEVPLLAPKDSRLDVAGVSP